MSLVWNLDSADLISVRVTGKLDQTRMAEAQAAWEPAIQASGRMRILVVLDSFDGWTESKDWADMSFADRNDQSLAGIAIVGDDKWRDFAYLFTAKGLRPLPIEFFSGSDDTPARAWLDSLTS